MTQEQNVQQNQVVGRLHTAQIADGFAVRSTGAIDLFPKGHNLHDLVKPSFSSVRKALSTFDITFVSNTTKYDPQRAGFRQCFSETYGDGAELKWPISAAYLSSPGQNTVFLPGEYVRSDGKRYAGIDPSVVQYMQQTGFLGSREGEDVFLISDLHEMHQELLRKGRKVLSFDDFPSSFDGVTANDSRTMQIVNSKAHVAELSSYAPKQVMLRFDEIRDSHFYDNWVTGQKLFIKCCNTESASEGVHPVGSIEEFRSKIAELKELATKLKLTDNVIIQPEIRGKNKSFQILIDPQNPNEIQVLAITDQVMAEDGYTYMGNVNHEVNAENVEHVGAAILDLVKKTRKLCPEVAGIVMCDYFHTPQGEVVLFDPGLRPTGNTPAAMVRMWIEEMSGYPVTVTNFVHFAFQEPGLPYSEIAKRLGKYADPEYILDTRYGLLPWGHNHIQGETMFMVATPTPSDFDVFEKEIRGQILLKGE